MAQYPPPPPFIQNPYQQGAPPSYTNVPQANMHYGYQYSQPMTYEQMMNLQMAYRQQQRQFQNKRLKEALPTKYVLVHGGIVAVLGIAQIILQIIAIMISHPILMNGGGLWAGISFLITAILTLIIVWKRNLGLFIAILILNMICFCIGMTAFGLNVANFSGNCSYFFCENYSVYYISMSIAGIICAIMCLVFFVIMVNFINGTCFYTGANSSVSVSYNGNNMYQPNQPQPQNQYSKPPY